MADLWKDIIPSILLDGNDLTESEGGLSGYVPFIVNKALSAYRDCVLFANDMNRYPNLPKEKQYKYLLASISKYKRPYQNWIKTKQDDRIDSIKRYYGCSSNRAKEYLCLLSDEEIGIIIKKMDRGGIENDAGTRSRSKK